MKSIQSKIQTHWQLLKIDTFHANVNKNIVCNPAQNRIISEKIEPALFLFCNLPSLKYCWALEFFLSSFQSKSRTSNRWPWHWKMHQKVGKSACEKFVYCCSLKSRQRNAESTGVLPPKFRKRRPKSSWNCSHYKEHEQTPLIHQNKVIHGVPLEQTFIFSLNNTSIEVMFGRTQLSI